MFTGIVEEQGTVRSVDPDPDRGTTRLEIACATVVDGCDVGDSIAVDGCCVTATTVAGDGLTADLMGATLGATTLGDLRSGDAVNLERPVAVGDRLGGHLVQGHVDGVGEVTARDEHPDTTLLRVRAPAGLARYLVSRGSVAVDGVSLTVAEVDGATFTVGLVPHTLEVTTLGASAPGDGVNLEVDVVAKYVERLVARGDTGPYG